VTAERRYWDADCFLGWLLAEADKEEQCRVVLEAAERGDVLLVSSALTIAEVLAIRGHPRIGDDRRVLVEGFSERIHRDPKPDPAGCRVGTQHGLGSRYRSEGRRSRRDSP
jgi:hypothetical protein